MQAGGLLLHAHRAGAEEVPLGRGPGEGQLCAHQEQLQAPMATLIFIHAAIFGEEKTHGRRIRVASRLESMCRLFCFLRMEIEEGRVMRFVLTPTKKLPESMSAFDPQTGTLFTGKFFSAHRSIGRYDSAVDSKGVEGWEEYVEDLGFRKSAECAACPCCTKALAQESAQKPRPAPIKTLEGRIPKRVGRFSTSTWNLHAALFVVLCNSAIS